MPSASPDADLLQRLVHVAGQRIKRRSYLCMALVVLSHAFLKLQYKASMRHTQPEIKLELIAPSSQPNEFFLIDKKICGIAEKILAKLKIKFN